MAQNLNNDIREPVWWFAGEMEKQLRANDAEKGPLGWRIGCGGCSVMGLFKQLKKEVIEVENVLQDGPACDVEELFSELADVANMAMMIADRVRFLRSGDGAQVEEVEE